MTVLETFIVVFFSAIVFIVLGIRFDLRVLRLQRYLFTRYPEEHDKIPWNLRYIYNVRLKSFLSLLREKIHDWEKLNDNELLLLTKQAEQSLAIFQFSRQLLVIGIMIFILIKLDIISFWWGLIK